MTHAITVPVSNKKQLQTDAELNAVLREILTASPNQISAYIKKTVTTVEDTHAVLIALAIQLRYLSSKI